MAENTTIAWATHTFSPWLGCSHVHAGCDHCYAEAMQGRLGVTWGPKGTRRRTADSTWRQVERWNRKAADACCSICRGQCHGGDPTRPCRYCRGTGNATGESDPRVFPSLCDPFEDFGTAIWDSQGVTSMDDVRRDFFSLIDRCPNLDFLLLTKRPQNVRRMWPDRGHVANHPAPLRRSNVWLLYSASDQATLDAGLPNLLACRDLAPVLGLSLEPLIGPVDLSRCAGVDWVIVGGESGRDARPCAIDWMYSIQHQCEAAGIPLFVKQLGSNPFRGDATRPTLRDPKGGDPYEWPEDLRVREFPR